jgi:toxin-antitoxin system PIN domain toxin
VIRLLDVNVLMALLWENHEQHEQARRWLRGVTEFATCPISQLGFARISSHPMLGFSMSPEQAFSVLRRFLADPRHRFIADDLSCEDRVVLTERIPNANAVTDHYLVALARQHGFALATFDEPLSRAFPSEQNLVELVT